MAKKENYEVVVTLDGKILERFKTGLIYDAYIKAHNVAENFKKKYPNATIEKVGI